MGGGSMTVDRKRVDRRKAAEKNMGVCRRVVEIRVVM